MSLFKITFLIAVAVGTAAFSDPLAAMVGVWKGTGWARETQQGPQETVRCQITNSYDTSTLTLTITGKCVVPGRRLTMSGTLMGAEGVERITGRWFNPDGIGSVRIVGIQREGIVAFNFSAKDPSSGRNLAQNVEWRVLDGSLRLRSTDRNDPNIMMSDISFRQ
ncbi:MAG: hypothetical protein ABJL67_05475 [Sulfitobacter sp.]